MALASSGEPTRFLTLTVNPQVGNDPEERCKMLARAWRIIVQRLRRLYEHKTINYLAIVEETKQGEPHLHILLRAPYIPQSLLSNWMGEILSSPIVDIRLIRNQREVVKYVAKYIAKAPAQFGHTKRYWCSRDYELEKPAKALPGTVDPFPWRIDRRPLLEIISEWVHEGFAARKDGDDAMLGVPIRSPAHGLAPAPFRAGWLS